MWLETKLRTGIACENDGDQFDETGYSTKVMEVIQTRFIIMPLADDRILQAETEDRRNYLAVR